MGSWEKFGKKYLLVCISGLLLVVAMVYWIDPFFHWHMPFYGENAVQISSINQNAGVARNDKYEAVVTGSSVTENFRVSWFEEMFSAETIKLPVGSGRTPNYAYIFDNIFTSKNDVKYVFYGLDLFALVCNPEETIQEIPIYLYDRNVFNDTKYIFNKSVLFEHIPKVLAQKDNFNEDEAYAWDASFEFGEEIAVNHYTKFVINSSVPASDITPSNAYLDNCQGNIDNFCIYIEQNPSTEFYIFYPPYSILYWHDKNVKGVTDAWIEAEKYATQKLLTYSNVKLFNFQTLEWIVCDLNNYKDYVHYTSEINYYMAESMKNDENRINWDNYEENFLKLKEIISLYDYEKVLLK